MLARRRPSLWPPAAVRHCGGPPPARRPDITSATTPLPKEGLSVSVDVAVTYRIDAESAVRLFQSVGPKWLEILLHPQVRATIRGVVAGYTSKELYEREARASVAEKVCSLQEDARQARWHRQPYHPHHATSPETPPDPPPTHRRPTHPPTPRTSSSI